MLQVDVQLPPLCRHSMAWLPACYCLFIWGGFDGHHAKDDMYSLDMSVLMKQLGHALEDKACSKAGNPLLLMSSANCL